MDEFLNQRFPGKRLSVPGPSPVPLIPRARPKLPTPGSLISGWVTDWLIERMLGTLVDDFYRPLGIEPNTICPNPAPGEQKAIPNYNSCGTFTTTLANWNQSPAPTDTAWEIAAKIREFTDAGGTFVRYSVVMKFFGDAYGGFVGDGWRPSPGVANRDPAVAPSYKNPNAIGSMPTPESVPSEIPWEVRRQANRVTRAYGWRSVGYTVPKPGSRNLDDPGVAVPPPSIRLPPHYAAPPGRGVKERKIKTNFPGWFAAVINFVTETDDWLDAALDALPMKLRCQFYRRQERSAYTVDKAAFVYRNWDSIDIGQFVNNAMWNLAEDYIFGRLSQAEQNYAGSLFENYGLQFARMLSTDTGKASKIASQYGPSPPLNCN